MKWQEYPINKVSDKDKDYPELLLKIKNHPKIIYYRGNLTQEIFEKSLSIVGSRRMSRYGKDVIDKFVPEFVANKITTISGFMYGVDTGIHKKTVEYDGITVAVFGSGINICYPPENDKLYTEILEKGGLVLSEYEPDSKPQLWKYPKRNRIVAGLASLGVLVVEAGEKSGSLITAEFAHKQGKKVFAVPGPVTSSVSVGTNLLIKNGLAKMVLDASDIVGRSKFKKERENKYGDMDSTERKIYQILENDALTIDEISRELAIDIIELNKALSLMSLKRFVVESMGKYYLVKN